MAKTNTILLKIKKQLRTPKSLPLNKKLDMDRIALKPGKRKTAWGTVYYEKRANRTDVKPTRHPYL